MGGDKDKDKEGDPRLRWVLDRVSEASRQSLLDTQSHNDNLIQGS